MAPGTFISQAREGVGLKIPSDSKKIAAAKPPAPVENLIQHRINAADGSKRMRKNVHPETVFRLAWPPPSQIPRVGTAPALARTEAAARGWGGGGSTDHIHFIGEPFARRDVQFNKP